MFGLALALKRPFAHETAVAEVGGGAAGATEGITAIIGRSLELRATPGIAAAMAGADEGNWRGSGSRSI